MEIKISENPNLIDLSKDYEKLTELKVEIVSLLNDQFIKKLNIQQFIYLIGLTSLEGKYFNLNFNFIKKYISNINIKERNLMFYIESNLSQIFLKRYETEESYLLFYSFFDGLYKKEKNVSKVFNKNLKVKKILFFVHSPVFLAHTNPLFYMLEKRKNLGINIAIASLSENINFTKKLNAMNIEFILLNGPTLKDQLNHLILLSVEYSRLIWQSVPLYLCYLSKRVNNICLWSFKFHPTISNVKKKLGSFVTYEKNFVLNGVKWENIDVGFNIKNIEVIPIKWSKRKLNFGSFCREELIDSEEYWLTIKSIIEGVKGSIFYYCGKKKIDEHWCKKLKIPTGRVVFLGWLKDPHIKLQEMAFLLDGYKLGHGYMSYEAMAAGIPIMFPVNRKSYGTMETFTKKISTHPKYKHLLKGHQKYFLNFKNNIEAIDISKKLMVEKDFNIFYGTFNRDLISKYPENTFEDFCETIYN